MSKRAFALALGLAAAWLCGVATSAQAVPSPQQVYDAAQAAYDKSDWADAAAGFATLLPTETGKTLGRSQAVMAYRYADCLRHLDRDPEARTWIDRALPQLRTDADQALLGEALVVRGDLARADFDYVAAAHDYDEAIGRFSADPMGLDSLIARLRLGDLGVTLDPAHVSQALDPVLKSPDFHTRLGPRDRAAFEDLAARAALNLGDARTATAFVAQAVSDTGPLSSQVNVQQSYVRADAGLIARLARDDDGARRYLSYSGAGHMDHLSWISDRMGALPVCGDGPGEPRPDDSVVVRFHITDDGAVSDATPVYASRIGLIGETFARTVSRWRWDPTQLEKISPFWRATLQLQLRCVTRPPTTSLDARAWTSAVAWLQAHGDPDVDVGQGRASKDRLFWVPSDPYLKTVDGAVLEALSRPLVRGDQIRALWLRLDAIHAPPEVYALMIERFADAQEGLGGLVSNGRAKAVAYSTWTAVFQHEFSDDPNIYWLQLNQAVAWQQGRDFKAADPLLRGIVAAPDQRLTESDPVRRVALLHQAMGLDRLGDPALALQTLARSGLTANQCTLFDTQPLPTNASIGSDMFPEEALRWNFEGYVEEAYDIKDDGSVDHVRTVIAYPPYIFDRNTELAVSRFRFLPPRLGGHAVGCDDARTPVVYHIGR